jgi:hypothetical protein
VVFGVEAGDSVRETTVTPGTTTPTPGKRIDLKNNPHWLFDFSAQFTLQKPEFNRGNQFGNPSTSQAFQNCGNFNQFPKNA